MIEKKLEITLITYNRSKDLENTFKQLLNSPFINCKIKILDNASTDETPTICAKYQTIFPKMEIIRHKKNIGANPNILRAVEVSESIYTWILCDDDNYDFSDCSDIIEAIESENFDIISIGSPGQYDWERGLSTTSNELIEKGSKYYHVFTFIPGFIFKTDLFDSECIFNGYYNVHNLYPHFPFINKSVEENYSLYISRKEIIIRGIHNTPGFSGLFWLKSWLNSCKMIKDKKIRRKTIYESPLESSFLSRIIFSIITEKIDNDSKEVLNFITAFINVFGFSRDIFLLIIILPLAIIPKFIYNLFINIYRFTKYKILKRNPHEKLLDENEDIFRS